LNGPDGNVNYSSVTGERTYFRRFTNTTGGSTSNFKLRINKVGTSIVQSSQPLTSTNIRVDAKIPQTTDGFTTGWMDTVKPFATGQNGDTSGCLVGALDTANNSENECTFGTQSVGDNEYIVLRVTADASWTGNISQITVVWL